MGRHRTTCESFALQSDGCWKPYFGKKPCAFCNDNPNKFQDLHNLPITHNKNYEWGDVSIKVQSSTPSRATNLTNPLILHELCARLYQADYRAKKAAEESIEEAARLQRQRERDLDQGWNVFTYNYGPLHVPYNFSFQSLRDDYQTHFSRLQTAAKLLRRGGYTGPLPEIYHTPPSAGWHPRGGPITITITLTGGDERCFPSDFNAPREED